MPLFWWEIAILVAGIISIIIIYRIAPGVYGTTELKWNGRTYYLELNAVDKVSEFIEKFPFTRNSDDETGPVKGFTLVIENQDLPEFTFFKMMDSLKRFLNLLQSNSRFRTTILLKMF